MERLQGGRGCGRRLSRVKRVGVGQAQGPPSLVHLSPLVGPALGTRWAGTRSRSRLSEWGAWSPGLGPGAHLPFAWVSSPSQATSAEGKGPEQVSRCIG